MGHCANVMDRGANVMGRGANVMGHCANVMGRGANVMGRDDNVLYLLRTRLYLPRTRQAGYRVGYRVGYRAGYRVEPPKTHSEGQKNALNGDSGANKHVFGEIGARWSHPGGQNTMVLQESRILLSQNDTRRENGASDPLR